MLKRLIILTTPLAFGESCLLRNPNEKPDRCGLSHAAFPRHSVYKIVLHFAKIQKKGTFGKIGLIDWLIDLAYLLSKKSQQKGPLLCHILDLRAPVAMTWDPLFVVFKLRAAILSALGAQDCSTSLGCKWKVRGSPNLSGIEETSCILPSDIPVESLSKERHLDTVELEGGSEVSRKHGRVGTLVSPLLSCPVFLKWTLGPQKYFILKCLGLFSYYKELQIAHFLVVIAYIWKGIRMCINAWAVFKWQLRQSCLFDWIHVSFRGSQNFLIPVQSQPGETDRKFVSHLTLLNLTLFA